MGGTREAFDADPLGFASRVRNAQAGAWLAVLCCLFYTAYTALTWSDGHRTTVLVVAAVALGASLLLTRLPLHRLMHSGVLREGFFLAWSALLVSLFSLAAAFDGGAGSPLATALVLPVFFAALSYPFGSMLVVGAMAFAAYLGLAVTAGGAAAAEVFFTAMVLLSGAWMGAWQARTAQLQRAELGRVSRTDPLTGCLNRRGFEERFAVELRRARRTGAPVGYVLLDLDSFKELNDLQGHAAGDGLLKWVVRTMERTLRQIDAIGRLGGDEFAILVPGASLTEARTVADRVRDALAARTPTSLGAAAFPADGEDAEALHHEADRRLYDVKHGRSAVHVPARRRELSWATSLARAADLRQGTGHEHSSTVGDVATAIGQLLGWPEQRLARLRLAAILHDVGKISMPDCILRKAGPLDDQELAIVRTHSAIGADMVAAIEGLEVIAPWIRHSHEHVDGSGYPRGLVGDAIPIESRIILVADAFEALTSGRAYRAALPMQQALDVLRGDAGRRFDAQCVELLCEALAGDARAPAPTAA